MSRIFESARGSFKVKKSWAKSPLFRMNFVRQKSSNIGKVVQSELIYLKEGFLNDICVEVIMNGIPDDLIFNWDHTGIHLLPVDDWTMEKQGSKNAVIKGSDDKPQITVVLAATFTGCFTYPHILYEGKINRCHPVVEFPEGYDLSHTSNH